jgi:hypothetical protein
MSVAGGYIFVGWTRQPSTGEQTLRVYRTSDGGYVGTMDHRTGQVGPVSWLDVFYSLEAHQQSNGEYYVYAEDDMLSKIVVYRWCPTGNCPPPTGGGSTGGGSGSGPSNGSGTGGGTDSGGGSTGGGSTGGGSGTTDPTGGSTDGSGTATGGGSPTGTGTSGGGAHAGGKPTHKQPSHPQAVSVAVHSGRATITASTSARVVVRISRRVGDRWVAVRSFRLSPSRRTMRLALSQATYRMRTYNARSGKALGSSRFAIA